MHLDFLKMLKYHLETQEYKVAVHTKEVDNALKIAHNYLGDKYIKLLSGKYNLYANLK